MNVEKHKPPVYDPGICRCCGSTKKCRVLNEEYEFCGQKEVYSDLFMDCYGLLLSLLDGDPADRLICATCVVRLREANNFRKQVLQCEETLLLNRINVHDVDEIESKIKLEEDKKNDLNADGSHYENAADSNHDDYDDYEMEPGSTPTKKQKSLKKERKTRKSTKLNKRGKRDNGKKKVEYAPLKNETMDAEEMLNNIKLMSEKLQLMENEPATLHEDIIEKPPKKLPDSEQNSFKDTVKLVENSYVCPFDTSYSDYYCIYCRETFTDPNKLRDHTLTHDTATFTEHFTSKKLPQIDITRIDCRLCPQPINTLEDFKVHAANVHKITLEDLPNEILKFRLTPTNLTCIECNATFGFFHALKKHMALHFGTCICDICGAHYFEERMLILHQKSHQRYDKNYPCKECDKTFKSKHSRYLHEAKTHKKEPAYQCSKCDDVFFSYSIRYRHLIDVHGEERMFQCEHCEKTYDSRKSLREHNRRNHLKIFKHQCDLCEKRFYLPSRLKEHIATHTGERNYRCEFCGKSYPRLRGLKVHMQSHSSEKKFRCVLCQASFTQNVNLKNHMKRQHQTMEMDESFN